PSAPLRFSRSATATTELYPLPLHDALPICGRAGCARARHAARFPARPRPGSTAARRPLIARSWPRQKRTRVRGGSTGVRPGSARSEEHTSELQSRENLVCRLLLEKKKETQE